MKLICLNLWIGNHQGKIIEFVKTQAQDADIFCFQEVISGGREGVKLDKNAHAHSFQDIAAALPAYAAYFTAAPVYTDFARQLEKNGAQGGQAIFIRKNIQIIDQGGFILYSKNPFEGQTRGGITGNFNYVIFENNKQRYVVGNIHGLWQEHKDDTPERLEQSRRLLEFFTNKQGRGVLVGDFNLRPETQSISLLSAHMRNLIAEYGITNTRNAEYVEMEKWKDYIADYAFVAPSVQVHNFKVLPDVVSDHAPLMLTFE